MPKRPRSEDDENYEGHGLLKTHISQKEVNMGVLQEKNMQEVYNKTMAMLFRGTKNLANNNAESNMETDVQCRKDKLNYRQLSLSSTCGLVPGTRDIATCCVSCVRPECLVTSVVCYDCRGGKLDLFIINRLLGWVWVLVIQINVALGMHLILYLV